MFEISCVTIWGHNKKSLQYPPFIAWNRNVKFSLVIFHIQIWKQLPLYWFNEYSSPSLSQSRLSEMYEERCVARCIATTIVTLQRNETPIVSPSLLHQNKKRKENLFRIQETDPIHRLKLYSEKFLNSFFLFRTKISI